MNGQRDDDFACAFEELADLVESVARNPSFAPHRAKLKLNERPFPPFRCAEENIDRLSFRNSSPNIGHVDRNLDFFTKIISEQCWTVPGKNLQLHSARKCCVAVFQMDVDWLG